MLLKLTPCRYFQTHNSPPRTESRNCEMVEGLFIVKGAFTYYVICRGGGGGFQKMTLDDGGGEGGGGGGGGLWSDDVIQNRSISGFLYLKKLLAVSVYCDNVEI